MKANQLHTDFKEFIKSLNSQEVRLLVVGAFVGANYGVIRNTDDIDI